MCRKGTRLEFMDEMREDLMQNFRAVLEDGGIMNLEEICIRTINRPAKKFYISALQAYKVVSKMRKGNFTEVNKMAPYRQEMFHIIYRMTEEYILKFEYANKSLLFIVSHVIASQAPRFYISLETMKRIFYVYKKQKKKCRLSSI